MLMVLLSIILWTICLYINKDGYIIPYIGGGCFGGGKVPKLNVPKLPTAAEIYGEATSRAKAETPLAYGAREGALGDLSKGTSFYESFQPTSIEQALGNQYFQNVFPDMERAIRHQFSLSGLEGTPALAGEIGKARGQVGFDIGSYLSNLGNQRASTSLSSRLALDPNQILSPYVNTAQSQSQAQGQFDMQSAMVNYNNEIAKQKKKAGLISGVGSALGGAAGFFLGGGPMGASIGASLGGSLGSAIGGGSGTPIDLGTALELGNLPQTLKREQQIGSILDQQLAQMTAGKTQGVNSFAQPEGYNPLKYQNIFQKF